MKLTENSNQSQNLGKAIVGTWWLLSRIDIAEDKSKRLDPALGDDPIAILTYTQNRFAAQFMKRERTQQSAPAPSQQGQNNTMAIGGYDAYFGTYEIDRTNGEVLHCLQGALAADNVGITVSRTIRVDNDQLEIQLETTTTEGEPITRTLTWERTN